MLRKRRSALACTCEHVGVHEDEGRKEASKEMQHYQVGSHCGQVALSPTGTTGSWRETHSTGVSITG